MNRPRRGEVWIVDLGLAAKVRPCLVVSIPITDADRVLATVVPHTTSVQATRYEVVVRRRFLKPGAFDVQNMASVPCGKFIRRIGELTGSEMKPIEMTILLWLGLPGS